VSRHVVRPLGLVHEQGIAVRDETLEEGDEIALHIGIGILLNEERRGGMAAEDVRHSRFDPRSPYDPRHLAGQFHEARAPRVDP